MSDTFCLEDILNRYTIKIPEVQRNYVQGNKDEITKRIRTTPQKYKVKAG